MLRKLLIAAALLTASGAALAHNDRGYGRVITVEPQVVISFGTRQFDGFRVLYESGGQHYWTYTDYRPVHTIVLPPRHHVHHHAYRDDWREGRRPHHREHRKHRRHDD